MATPTPPQDSPESRDSGSAVKRGLRRKCPRCGEGALFSGYLKVRAECPCCGLDLTPQRADDGPAYVVILVVCHIVGFLLPLLFGVMRDDPLLLALVLSVVAVGLSLVMLPSVKGMFIALQWAKGLHGFGLPRPATG